MANIIKPKRTNTPGAVPNTTQLEVGEIAINARDGILYIRDDLGTIREVGRSVDLSTCLPLTGGTITGSLEVDNDLTVDGAAYFNGAVRLGDSNLDNITVNGSTTFNGDTGGIDYNHLDNKPDLTAYATNTSLNNKLDITGGTATDLTLDGSLTEHYTNAGNAQGTFSPNTSNGTIQEYRLTGNIDFSGFTGGAIGDVITIILKQDATGGRTWSNFGNITCYYAGGIKDLSAGPNARDVMTILKTGSTTYYISIANGFTT